MSTAIESRGTNYRDYSVPVSESEKKDIALIVNTLGKVSLLSLPAVQGNLEKAGVRVKKIHPLQFLHTIFSDAEMKKSLQVIVTRDMVKDKFLNGLKSSLQEESANDNLKADHIAHFAANLKIHPDLITPHIKEKNWNKMVEALLTHHR